MADSNFSGFFDYIGNGSLRGWCVDLCNTNDPVELEVWLGDEKVGSMVCSLYRPDVCSALGIDVAAVSGFVFDIKTMVGKKFCSSLLVYKQKQDEFLGLNIRVAANQQILPVVCALEGVVTSYAALEAALDTRLDCDWLGLGEPLPAYLGAVDQYADGCLRGWVLALDGTPPILDLYLENKLLCSVIPHAARRDISNKFNTLMKTAFEFSFSQLACDHLPEVIDYLASIPDASFVFENLMSVRVRDSLFTLPCLISEGQVVKEVCVSTLKYQSGYLYIGENSGRVSVKMDVTLSGKPGEVLSLRDFWLGVRDLVAFDLMDLLDRSNLWDNDQPLSVLYRSFDGLCSVTASGSIIEVMEALGFEWIESIAVARQKVYRKIISLCDAEAAISDIPEYYRSCYFPGLAKTDKLREQSDDVIFDLFFDSDYYLTQLSEMLPKTVSPLDHYKTVGAFKGLNPHSLFDTNFVRRQLRGDARDGAELFLEFIRNSGCRGHLTVDPHPLFSTVWYRDHYSLDSTVSPWVDYVMGCWMLGREPSVLFCGRMISEALSIPLCMDTELTPLHHYMIRQDDLQFAPHPVLSSAVKRAIYIAQHNSGDLTLYSDVVDIEYYLSQFDNDMKTPRNVLVDYLTTGEFQGFSPNVVFDCIWYRKTYGYFSVYVGALAHFLLVGEKKGLNPSPVFDSAYYRSRNLDVVLNAKSPIRHFVARHRVEGHRRPSRKFDSLWFQRNAPAGLGALRDVACNNLIEAVSPHPLIDVDERVLPRSVRELLYASDSSTQKLAPGVSVLGLDAKATLGEVHQYINAFEESIETWTEEDSHNLMLREDIRRMYESFDISKFEAIFDKAQQVVQLAGKAPLVSIIMPCRNRETVIGRAIESILQQSYNNFEIVIVDDGSTDGTASVCEAFNSDKIKVVRIPPTGVSSARNVGLSHASGEYIAYLDSDNTWEPGYLTCMVGSMLSTGAKLSHSGLRVFTPSGTIRYRGDVYNKDAMDRENYIDMNILVHHRDVLVAGFKFDESLKRCVDWDFIRRSALQFGGSFYVPVVGCNYLDDDGKLERITTNAFVGDYYRLASRQMIKNITGTTPDQSIPYSIIWSLNDDDARERFANLWSALYHLENGAHELIVIANGLSIEATGLMVALSKRLNRLRVIHLPRTFLDYPAYNLGASIAVGQQFLFWHGHVEYKSSTVDHLVGLGRQSSANITLPVVVDELKRVSGSLFTVAPEGGSLVDFMKGQKLPQESGVVVHGVGASDGPLLIQKNFFESLGGFDFEYSLNMAMAKLCLDAMLNDKQSLQLSFDHSLYASRSVFLHGSTRARQKEKTALTTSLRLPVNWKIEAARDSSCRAGQSQATVSADESGVAKSGVGIRILPQLSYGERGLNIRINCPAPDDETKLNWGDYHFGKSLSNSLIALGHRVELCLRNYWSDSTPGIDLVIHIRGIVDCCLSNNAANIIWIISHPEKVTLTEVKDADIVFSSSAGVSKLMYERFDIDSPVLLQATDRQKFFWSDKAESQRTERFLFVGNSRNQYRRVVMEAVKYRDDLDVYGDGWNAYIPLSYIKANYLDNDYLSGYYQSALAVLNDHWSTMARFGIISNRIFDVVASGGVVVSDRVEGISDIFGNHVKICDNELELKEIMATANDWVPSPEVRKAMSIDILKQHSFDARAEKIIKEFFKRNVL